MTDSSSFPQRQNLQHGHHHHHHHYNTKDRLFLIPTDKTCSTETIINITILKTDSSSFPLRQNLQHRNHHQCHHHSTKDWLFLIPTETKPAAQKPSSTSPSQYWRQTLPHSHRDKTCSAETIINITITILMTLFPIPTETNPVQTDWYTFILLYMIKKHTVNVGQITGHKTRRLLKHFLNWTKRCFEFAASHYLLFKYFKCIRPHTV